MATITLTCPVCGITKEVKSYPSRIPRFCSRQCTPAGLVKTTAKTPYIGGPQSHLSHRAVVEKAIGITLPSKAVIHHVDGNGRNNSHRNLVVCQNQSYHMLLHTRQRVLDAGGDPNSDKICGRCAKVLSQASFYREKGSADGFHGWCKACVTASRIATNEAL